ncbi:arylsulfatase [Polaribacter filamentus]|jgi:arylsulfatase A|uniref:Arylsulfatase n=1 Tax=Polaribacter filamentus TaxID=53483 RepID=A0A2S7L1Z5_9FLAO|nr:arylsulfatase [Polaribacter filamentus]PQB08935.1 arylsulfatase [Polaribacter filamentus]
MKNLINNTLFLILSLVIVSCSSTQKKNASEKITSKKKPNIIYILADDLGYGDLSSFNENGKIKTPNLDAMASEGMMFTDAHTSSSVCTPTRYGILTGRYNWRSRLKRSVLRGTSKALIPNDRSTLASILKASGYQTAFIGKWHLGWDWAKNENNEIDFSKEVTNTPNDLGFDYAYGHCGSLDMAPYVYVENGFATQIPTELTESKSKYGWWRNGLTSADFVHEDVTPNFFRRGIKYVQEQATAEKPFFLYLPLPSPHTPILPTEEWQNKSGLNPYGDFVMMFDDYVGQLLKAVKDAGIEENTLIVFTSDNGCSPAAKIDELTAKNHSPSYTFRGHKADIFEGGHRVPFIVKWPASVKAGSVSNQTICTTDFFATSAEIVNYKMKASDGEDSFSMMPLLEGKDRSTREATIHHSINGNFAIRKGDWKLIMTPDSGGWSYPNPKKDKDYIKTLPKIQLYNLDTDIAEATNVQADYPEKVSELKQLLTQQILKGRSTPGLDQKNDTGNTWKQLSWMN